MAGMPLMNFRVPDAPPMFSTRAVLSAWLTSLGDNARHLAEVRARGWHPTLAWEPAWDGAGIAWDSGLYSDADNIAQTHRICLRTSPLSSHLLLFLVASSRAATGSATPEVVATLTEISGASVDVGCRWTRDDGSFPASEADRFVVPNGVTALTGFALQPALLQTSAFRQDGLAGAGSPSAPRALYLGGKGGDDLALVVTTTSARVHAIVGFEMVEAL